MYLRYCVTNNQPLQLIQVVHSRSTRTSGNLLCAEIKDKGNGVFSCTRVHARTHLGCAELLRARWKAIGQAFQGRCHFLLACVSRSVHLGHGLQGTHDILLNRLRRDVVWLGSPNASR